MNPSLSELIIDDFRAFANVNNDSKVASEQAIRLMIHYANYKGLTANMSLLQLHKLHDRLTEIQNECELTKRDAHYQFFVDATEQKERTQGNRVKKRHYCALDLFCRENTPPIAFVADHYRGFAGFDTAFEKISKDFGIQFYVSGYPQKRYQSDTVSCPIFTLNHLLLSSKDESLLPFLDGIPKTDMNKMQIEFDWSQLPPQYMAYLQSFNLLAEYIDIAKARENLTKEQSSSRLLEHRFTDILTRGLTSVTTKAKKTNETDSIKLQNNSIKFFAIQYCGKVSGALISEQEQYTEERLIDICYQDYPNVCSLLKKALKNQNSNEPHPLFKVTFDDPGQLERLLNIKDFNKIFETEALACSGPKF